MYYGIQGGTDLGMHGNANPYETGYVIGVNVESGCAFCTVMRTEGGVLSSVPIIGRGTRSTSAESAGKSIVGCFVMLTCLNGQYFVINTIPALNKPLRQIATNSLSKSNSTKAKSSNGSVDIDGSGDENASSKAKAPQVKAKLKERTSSLSSKLSSGKATDEDILAANSLIADIDPSMAGATTASEAASNLAETMDGTKITSALSDAGNSKKIVTKAESIWV